MNGIILLVIILLLVVFLDASYHQAMGRAFPVPSGPVSDVQITGISHRLSGLSSRKNGAFPGFCKTN